MSHIEHQKHKRIALRYDPQAILSKNPKSRDRYYSSFDSVTDLQLWLISFGAQIDPHQIEMIEHSLERGRQNPERFKRYHLDYRLIISGPMGRARVRILRQLFDKSSHEDGKP